MTELIRGKVARILSSREVVINRGSSAGVARGMRFAILDATGEDVRDPDTGQSLGSVNRVKVELEISQVDENLSVARTFRQRTVNVGGSGSALGVAGLSDLFTPPKYVKKYETIKLSEANYEPLSERDSIVEVGDTALQIRKDNDDEQTTGIVGGSVANVDPSNPAS